jgi:hypothetical protein
VFGPGVNPRPRSRSTEPDSLVILAAKDAYVNDRIDAEEMERRIDQALRDPVAAWAAFAVGGPPVAAFRTEAVER